MATIVVASGPKASVGTEPRENSQVRAIAPKEIRYIKLGPGGAWEERALKRGELYLGRPTEPLDLIGKHDWKGVAAFFRKQGRRPGMASYMARENREFLTFGADCLWITFS